MPLIRFKKIVGNIVYKAAQNEHPRIFKTTKRVRVTSLRGVVPVRIIKLSNMLGKTSTVTKFVLTNGIPLYIHTMKNIPY